MPGIIINAPSNFVATPNRAGSSIGLSWTDNARNETDYMVEERVSTDNGVTYGPWTPLAGTPIASAPVPNGVGFMTFSRANVPTTLGLLYAFRVSARAVPSDSPYAYVQSNLQAPALPAAPALTGSLNTATRMVTLNWNAITPAAGTTISYIVNVNGVPVATNLTTYTYRATVAQLSGGIALNYTVQSVARAIRVAGQTVFGSSTSSRFESGNAASGSTGSTGDTDRIGRDHHCCNGCGHAELGCCYSGCRNHDHLYGECEWRCAGGGGERRGDRSGNRLQLPGASGSGGNHSGLEHCLGALDSDHG